MFKAHEQGWIGPPFNPVSLAGILGVPIKTNADIADARTIVTDKEKQIEYNPKQIRERVRFSIAHEIAHLLFENDGEKIRNRGGVLNQTDDWQLELLCNLAASEFVMPIGSLPSRNSVPSIEEIMNERRRFDVSAEAFLIRVIKTTYQSSAMFCASPHLDDNGKYRYRIEYYIPSINSPTLPIVWKKVPRNSVVYRCTAIGYTDCANEDWVDGFGRKIECVGIPGYPGSRLPRVAGVIGLESAKNRLHPVHVAHGNVLRPRGDGNRLICQLVNDRARKWGGGIARRTARKFPEAEKQFAEWIISQPISERLGLVHFSLPQDGIVIASIIAQEGFGRSLFPRIRYGALERCLYRVAEFSHERNFSIHMPRIGTGDAGGAWDAIEEIVDQCLISSGLSVTVYDLPPKRLQLDLFA